MLKLLCNKYRLMFLLRYNKIVSFGLGQMRYSYFDSISIHKEMNWLCIVYPLLERFFYDFHNFDIIVRIVEFLQLKEF